jgi:predicted DNA-binding ribbon-helix-helix protein
MGQREELVRALIDSVDNQELIEKLKEELARKDEQLGNVKNAFRVNMLRSFPDRENVSAEIDRVLAATELTASKE